MNEKPSESFYSKLKEFDSDLTGPFKNFFDYHKDEIIFADFTQKEAKENDEMKVMIASIGLNAEKDKKGAERKRIEARSGKILDGCLVVNCSRLKSRASQDNCVSYLLRSLTVKAVLILSG